MDTRDAAALRTVSEHDALVTYELDEGESIENGLLASFDAIGFDLSEQDPPLAEFVAPSALDNLQWSNRQLHVVTRIWEHPVLITAETITIYAADRQA